MLLGTANGLYAFEAATGRGVTPVSTELEVLQLHEGIDAVYAATDSGVYRIRDDELSRIGLRDERVVAVHERAENLYAGTRPAHLYCSADDGETWIRVESFDEIPGKDDWTQNHMGPAQVRDVRTHENAPSKLFVAVETAGMYVSPDGGRTWEYRGRGLDNDPHGLRVLGQDTLIATCGRGLYRTDDAGDVWYRLDTHHDYFWFQYFREGIVHEGVYYTSVMDRSRHRFEDRDEGLILRSTDGGGTFSDQEFPGHEDDYVNAWTAIDDRVFGGTVGGRLLEGPGEWNHVATVDDTIRSLAVQ